MLSCRNRHVIENKGLKRRDDKQYERKGKEMPVGRKRIKQEREKTKAKVELLCLRTLQEDQIKLFELEKGLKGEKECLCSPRLTVA